MPRADDRRLGAGGRDEPDARPGLSGLAVPLIAEDLFVGLVPSNTGQALAFPAADGDLGALLARRRPVLRRGRRPGRWPASAWT